jgi:hypothetical protein
MEARSTAQAAEASSGVASRISMPISRAESGLASTETSPG